MIMTGNRIYFSNIKLLKSNLLSGPLKLKLYMILIRAVVTCSSETWIMSEMDDIDSCVFECKVVQRIYGSIRKGEEWRIRSNSEIKMILKGKDSEI